MAVTQAVVDFDVATACGVELSGTRHETATNALALHPEGVASRVRLARGDCAADDAWTAGGALHGATVVWLCSELFNDELMCAGACNRMAWGL